MNVIQVLKNLREEDPDAAKLTKEELISKMNKHFSSKLDTD
jgi:hypothetical protein